jgi:hypothetical protein
MPNLRRALARLWARLKPRDTNSLSVQIGGEHIAVRPLGLEAALEFMLLLAPYVGSLDRHLDLLIEAANQPTAPERRGFLKVVLTAMADEMERAPGDITRAVALMLDREPDWVALNALPEEIVEALAVLDRVNDFGSLFNSLRALGLTTPKIKGDNGSSR